MACINVTSIVVKNNPSPLMTPFKFQITFEALTALKEDVEWRIIYVGEGPIREGASLDAPIDASTTESKLPGEIELDCVALGPIKRGVLSFEFVVKPPNFYRMDPDNVLGMQAVLVTASYKRNEFIRIGYFLNHIYMDPHLRENPPYPPQLSEVARCIIADSPRVTRFPIHWDDFNPELAVPEEEAANNNFTAIDNAEGAGMDENKNVFMQPPATWPGSSSCFSKTEGNSFGENHSGTNGLPEDIEMEM